MARRYRALCDCGFDRTYDTRGRAEGNLARHVCRSRDQVRRATRRYRCKRCGLEATYENAGAREARYWFDRHSCRKREQAMLRASVHELRMAMVDRTPKPCLHKQANHQHGTRACYVLDRCRCEPCSQANREAEQWRTRQKAYGRYTRYVNADLVRQHIAGLREAGMGLKTIAKRSGVSNGALTKIVYGTYAPATGPHKGRNGNGALLRGPARRVTRETAEKVFALDPAWNGPLVLADGANIDGTGTRLRLRALVALGYSIRSLGVRLNITNIHTLVHGTANANSLLYGAAWRAAKALGYHRLVTYTQADEPGSSLRAAGWRVIGERTARKGWDAPSRPRDNGSYLSTTRTLWEAS